jgi:hypothetical protein
MHADTKDQLKHVLLPLGRTIPTLRHIVVHVLSPNFFAPGFVSDHLLCEAFSKLKVIDLHFRLEGGYNVTDVTGPQMYRDVSNGALRKALQNADDLEELTINFEEGGFYPLATLDAVVGPGDKSWPKLNTLDIDCMSTTEDAFLKFLRNQPMLSDLRIGQMSLTHGLWPAVTKKMRKVLNLGNFVAIGILEDPSQMYALAYIDGQAYAESFNKITMSEALSMWMTDGYRVDAENPEYNPLADDAFDCEDDLRDEYGPFSNEEEFSDMDCDSD